ncbi:MAG TPA: hypothetical protein VNV65_07680 [Candidatus Solibacter sp.]|jgi:hypothetical protein|nr:hypothetical protein [Candidatus Solibacter sp.]
MRLPERFAAALVALAAAAASLAAVAATSHAALAGAPTAGSSPQADVIPSPSASSCPRSLKFAGSLYLDTDASASPDQVGPRIGETEPNPAQCAIPDRQPVYRHVGHNATDEVIAFTAGHGEVFQSAGQTGFPGGAWLRLLVVLLVLGIILFAAAPAILGHLRQPPVAVGRGDTDWIDDVAEDRRGDESPSGPEP